MEKGSNLRSEVEDLVDLKKWESCGSVKMATEKNPIT